MESVTFIDIIKSIEELDIPTDVPVIVHSRLHSIGSVVGHGIGQDITSAYLAAIRHVLGERSTIAVPPTPSP